MKRCLEKVDDVDLLLFHCLEAWLEEERPSYKSNELSPSDSSLTSESTSQIDELQRQHMHLQFRQDTQLTKSRWLKSHVPRIVKRDLRMKFPMMFTNVFNSLDYDLIRSFFHTFCHPHQTIFNHLASFPSSKNLIPICMFQLTCVDDIIRYLGGLQQLTPDLVLTIKSFQIIRRPDCDGSILKCQFHGSGTHLYPLHPGMIASCIEYHHNQQRQQQLCNKKRRLSRIPLNETKNMTISSEEPQQVLYQRYDLDDPKSVHSCGIPLLPKPIRREVDSTILFRMDESFRISMISFDSEVDGEDLQRLGK